MDEPRTPQASGRDVPWPQRAFNSVWILALAAMLYFFLSYALWGLINLWQTPPAG
jgi:hypothetical protein